MKCSLRDSLEWLYSDSKIDGEPTTSLDCDVPVGGVADVNVLVTDIDPDKPLRFSSDAPGGEFFRLIDVPVERNTGPDAFTERDGGPLNEFVTRRAPFRVFDAMEPLTGDSLTPADVEQLTGKCIMITGSAGSIGSEMVRQIAIYNPSELVLVDAAETPQHDIRLMMHNEWPDIKAHTIVANICEKDYMEALFKKYKPHYVFHAAAYKHVPMMEDNPSESVRNNIIGTRVIADLAVKMICNPDSAT